MLAFWRAIVAFSIIGLALIGCDQVPEQSLSRAQKSIDERDYRSAVIDLKATLQLQPNNKQARWMLGNIYLDLEDGASAEKELRRARQLGVADDSVLPLLARALLQRRDADGVLALQPKNALSAMAQADFDASRALAYLANEQIDDANAALEAARTAAPDSRWVSHVDLQFLVKEKKYDEVRKKVDAILERDAANGEAWSIKGQMFSIEGSYAAAEEAFSNAVENLNVFHDELIRRGYARLALGKLELAAQDAAQSLKIAPKESTTRYFAAVVRVRQGREQEAMELLEKVYSEDRGNVDSAFLLAVLQRKEGNRVRALALAEEVVSRHPRHIPGRILLASLYSEAGKSKEAERLVRPVVDALPQNIEARQLLAASLARQGRSEEAIVLLVDVAANRSEDAPAQARAGLALLQSSRTEEAMPYLQLAVKLAPDDSSVFAPVIRGLIRAEQWDDAHTLINQFVETQPTNAVVWELKGAAALEKNNADDARDAFRRAVELDPTNAAAILLAGLEMHQGNRDAARTLLEAGLRQVPDNAEFLYALARLDVTENRLDEARILLEKAVAVAPNISESRVALAKLLVATGDSEKALSLLTEGVAVDEAILLARADVYYERGSYYEAKLALDELKLLVPNEPGLYIAYAKVESELGNLRELTNAVDRILSLSPTNAWGKMAKVRLLALQGRYADADVLQASIELPKDDLAAIANTYFLAVQRGDWGAALEIAEHLFEAAPSTRTVLALATSLARMGQVDDAETHLARWLDQHSNDVVAREALGLFYVQTGRLDEALKLLQSGLEENPNSPSLLNNLAWHSRDSQPARALELAQKAIELEPDSPAILDTYAELLARNGKSEQARSTIDRAVDRTRNSALMRIRRAEVLHLIGDDMAAIRELTVIANEENGEQVRQRAMRLIEHLSAESTSGGVNQ